MSRPQAGSLRGGPALARAQGAEVMRYNLAQEPSAFANRPVIAAMMTSGGEDVLPIVMVDGVVRFSGTRPSRQELA